MTRHFVLGKEAFMHTLEKLIGDEQVVLLSTAASGEWKASTKDSHPQISFSVPGTALKRAENLQTLLKSFCAGIVIVNREDVSDEMLSKLDADSEEEQE